MIIFHSLNWIHDQKDYLSNDIKHQYLTWELPKILTNIKSAINSASHFFRTVPIRGLTISDLLITIAGYSVQRIKARSIRGLTHDGKVVKSYSSIIDGILLNLPGKIPYLHVDISLNWKYPIWYIPDHDNCLVKKSRFLTYWSIISIRNCPHKHSPDYQLSSKSQINVHSITQTRFCDSYLQHSLWIQCSSLSEIVLFLQPSFLPSFLSSLYIYIYTGSTLFLLNDGKAGRETRANDKLRSRKGTRVCVRFLVAL